NCAKHITSLTTHLGPQFIASLTSPDPGLLVFFGVLLSSLDRWSFMLLGDRHRLSFWHKMEGTL
ncbi:hypothetical protein ACJX0J_023526, partial [Zea mays]